MTRERKLQLLHLAANGSIKLEDFDNDGRPVFKTFYIKPGKGEDVLNDFRAMQEGKNISLVIIRYRYKETEKPL
jgi:hypothetical protein